MKIKLLFALLLICFVVNGYSQALCEPPEIIFNKGSYNIFNDEQEMYLGEVIAETLEKNFRVIRDEEANSYLQRVGNKLVKHLPKTNLKYSFHVIDTPQLNAFATAGGRIYVTRKMVAFLNSEDELAGVLGHELGHAVVRHVSIDISKLFKKILKVEEVGGREDVFRRYNEYLDKRNTKRVRLSSGHENKQQLEADNIGVFSMVAAGYDPEAMATAWNRLTEIRGRTGSGIGDLFGTTSPAEKRLREILNAIKTIPSECLDKSRIGSGEDFREWQSYVVSTSEFAKKEKLSAMVVRSMLKPFLRGDILHFQFSPDGEYIIAQDSSGINVLKRNPFSFVFRINVRDAKFANFSPDSKHISFQTYGLRVEKWSIEKRKPILAKEVYVRGRCWTTALSLNGDRLVCYSFARNLDIIDVTTNKRIFRKKQFYIPRFFDFYNWWFDLFENDAREIDEIRMEFSPNGKYLLVSKVNKFRNNLGNGPFFSEPFLTRNIQRPYLGFDLEKNEEFDLSGKIKSLMKVPFAFYSDDSIIGQSQRNAKKAGIYSFPDGKQRKKFVMRANSFTRPFKNNLILVRPTTTNPVGVFNTDTNKFVASNKTPALDLYENYLISESKEGYIGLFELKNNFQSLEEKGYITIPKNNLGDIRNISLSPDSNWLAVSEKSRGAIWDLRTGRMKIYTRGFRGAYFDETGKVYADFVGQNQEPRTMGMMNTKNGVATKLDPINTRNTKQFGKFLVRYKTKDDEKIAKREQKKKDKKVGYEDPEEKNGRPRLNITRGYLTGIDFGPQAFGHGVLQIYNAGSRKMMWSKEFKTGIPGYSFDPYNDTATFYFPVKSKMAQKAINDDPALKEKAKELKNKDGDYLVQVLDANTGVLKNQILVETGKRSFRIVRAFADKKWLTIIDSQNRVQLYSLADGKRQWQFFGGNVAINPSKPLAVVENIAGQLSVFNLENGKKIEKLLFPEAISFSRFSQDGERLFVLTASQNFYFFETDGFFESRIAD